MRESMRPLAADMDKSSQLSPKPNNHNNQIESMSEYLSDMSIGNQGLNDKHDVVPG